MHIHNLQQSIDALTTLRSYLPNSYTVQGWQNVRRGTARLVIFNCITVTYFPPLKLYEVRGIYTTLRTPHTNVALSTIISLAVEANSNDTKNH